MNNEKCIDICNSLLRGELSAIETYVQVLKDYNDNPDAAKLRDGLVTHEKNANTLRNNIMRMGGTPSEDSGAWGTFAKAVEGTAKLFGEESAVTALKEGEKHGRSEYEDAIRSEEVMPECKVMIEKELLPTIDSNISRLERYNA